MNGEKRTEFPIKGEDSMNNSEESALRQKFASTELWFLIPLSITMGSIVGILVSIILLLTS
jgi:hypothetical protein